MSPVVKCVKPCMLEWAVKRSGKPHPECEPWIKGESYPTLRELREFAESANCPIGYLFMNTPPDESYKDTPEYKFLMRLRELFSDVYQAGRLDGRSPFKEEEIPREYANRAVDAMYDMGLLKASERRII